MKAVGMNDFVPIARKKGKTPKIIYGVYERRQKKVEAARKVVEGVALKRGSEYPGRKVLEAASQASTPGRNANIGSFSGEQSLNDLVPLIYNINRRDQMAHIIEDLAAAQPRSGRELVAGFLAGVMTTSAAGLLFVLIIASEKFVNG